MASSFTLSDKLKNAVLKDKVADVKKIVSLSGKSSLSQEYTEYGNQEYYPDLFRYYLIHLAIQNHSLEMIKFLAENNVSPLVNYIKESNFNSRADQYMDTDSMDILQWAQYCNANKKVLDFLIQWKNNYRGH